MKVTDLGKHSQLSFSFYIYLLYRLRFPGQITIVGFLDNRLLDDKKYILELWL